MEEVSACKGGWGVEDAGGGYEGWFAGMEKLLHCIDPHNTSLQNYSVYSKNFIIFLHKLESVKLVIL